MKNTYILEELNKYKQTTKASTFKHQLMFYFALYVVWYALTFPATSSFISSYFEDSRIVNASLLDFHIFLMFFPIFPTSVAFYAVVCCILFNGLSIRLSTFLKIPNALKFFPWFVVRTVFPPYIPLVFTNNSYWYSEFVHSAARKFYRNLYLYRLSRILTSQYYAKHPELDEKEIFKKIYAEQYEYDKPAEQLRDIEYRKKFEKRKRFSRLMAYQSIVKLWICAVPQVVYCLLYFVSAFVWYDRIETLYGRTPSQCLSQISLSFSAIVLTHYSWTYCIVQILKWYDQRKPFPSQFLMSLSDSANPFRVLNNAITMVSTNHAGVRTHKYSTLKRICNTYALDYIEVLKTRLQKLRIDAPSEYFIELQCNGRRHSCWTEYWRFGNSQFRPGGYVWEWTVDLEIANGTYSTWTPHYSFNPPGVDYMNAKRYANSIENNNRID